MFICLNRCDKMEIKEVSERNGDVTVLFQDGHKAIFEPYSHGFGYQVEGLRRFVLKNEDDETVVIVNGRLHRCGPMGDEGKIAQLGKGYTVQDIVKYWSGAREGIIELEKGDNDKYWYPWILTGKGWIYIDSLKKGIMGMV